MDDGANIPFHHFTERRIVFLVFFVFGTILFILLHLDPILSPC